MCVGPDKVCLPGFGETIVIERVIPKLCALLPLLLTPLCARLCAAVCGVRLPRACVRACSLCVRVGVCVPVPCRGTPARACVRVFVLSVSACKCMPCMYLCVCSPARSGPSTIKMSSGGEVITKKAAEVTSYLEQHLNIFVRARGDGTVCVCV